MEFETFLKEISEGLEQRTGFAVEVREVLKNNGIRLHGLILEDGKAVRPTIYAEGLFKAWRDQGIGMEQIISKAIELLQTENSEVSMDVEEYSNFEKIRRRVFYKLICYQKNQALLKTVPYMRFLDLAKVFVVDTSVENSGQATILIRWDHVNLWGIDLDELNLVAEENTERMFPAMTLRMSDVIGALDPDLEWTDGLNNMFVITNEKKMFGASVLNYARFFRKFADNIGWKNLIILPSSVHELIVAPDDGRAKDLEPMVKEINETVVSADDVLSDSVYLYRYEEDRIEVA